MTKEEAIEKLKYCKSVHNGSFGAALKIAIKALEQEPKTGHWIDKKCSACGCKSMMGLCIENYCANCGAKMVKQQESEDEE